MILVTGATGRLGREILSLLVERGAPVRGSSRRGAEALSLIDFDDPSSISLSGVDTLVMVSAGEAEDDVVIDRHESVISAAERDGVGHLIYTSLTGQGDHLAFALAHRWTERRIRHSTGLNWTILRNGLYADLFGSLVQWSEERLTSAFGTGALSAVTREDLAEAAAVVAESPHRHVSRIYDLVGVPITAQQIAERLGTPVVDISLEERRRQLDGAGLRPFQPAMLMSIHSSVKHGYLGETGTDLEQLLGRPPRDALEVAVATARASAPR